MIVMREIGHHHQPALAPGADPLARHRRRRRDHHHRERLPARGGRAPRRRAAIAARWRSSGRWRASTATTCAAFLPLLLMTGVLGKFFADHPEGGRRRAGRLADRGVLRPAEPHRRLRRDAPRERARRETRCARIGARVDARLREGPALGAPPPLLVVFGAYAVCVGMIVAAATSKDVVLFTEGDVEMFDVRVRMPTDAAAEETDRVLREIERRLLALESDDVRGGGGDPRLLTHPHLERQRRPHRDGQRLHGAARPSAARQDAGTRLMERGGAPLRRHRRPGQPRGREVRGRPAARRAGGGADLAATTSTSARRAERARAGGGCGRSPGTRDVGDDYELGKRELRVQVDEERAALHGLTTDDVTRWLATAFGAAPVGDDARRRRGGRHRRAPRRGGARRSRAARRADLGHARPARTVALARGRRPSSRAAGSSTIRRRDRRRVITVTAELIEGSGATSAEVNARARERLRAADAPPTRTSASSSAASTRSTQRVARTRSSSPSSSRRSSSTPSSRRSSARSSQPLIVMTAIPLSMIGVSLGFFVSGEAVGLIGLIGVVGLAGIVVNDSLVLVDFINQRRAEGADLDEAIVEAGAPAPAADLPDQHHHHRRPRSRSRSGSAAAPSSSRRWPPRSAGA